MQAYNSGINSCNIRSMCFSIVVIFYIFHLEKICVQTWFKQICDLYQNNISNVLVYPLPHPHPHLHPIHLTTLIRHKKFKQCQHVYGLSIIARAGYTTSSVSLFAVSIRAYLYMHAQVIVPQPTHTYLQNIVRLGTTHITAAYKIFLCMYAITARVYLLQHRVRLHMQTYLKHSITYVCMHIQHIVDLYMHAYVCVCDACNQRSRSIL
eukprot:TRINITY_DN3679_c1_g1_i1.p1 TRINITY_DN3679_c1_g1~~TRINITY_DN3679_c1_g1_i1.p1  ORF type:complete len:208 (-),score=-24.74 TRINITY_DN3679_c1_g1_i1:527-1150(-)